MSEVWRRADLIAYVDECLDSEARLEIEADIAGDPELAREIALWRAQNAAIRSAFAGQGLRGLVLDLGRQANENAQRTWRPPPAKPRAPPPGPPARTLAAARRPAAASPAGRRFAAAFSHSLAVGLLALAMIAAVASSPTVPRQRFGEAAIAAYRAYAAEGGAGFDFASRDAGAISRWLGPRFARPIAAPDLAARGFAPVGVRIAPALGSIAAFVVYETADRDRVGLLVQPLDAPGVSEPATAADEALRVATWTTSADAFALVDAFDRAATQKLARSLIESLPD